MEIGEKSRTRLKEIRKELGLSQKELANKIGISTRMIEKIEQGERKGSDETWEKILNYYDEIKNK